MDRVRLRGDKIGGLRGQFTVGAINRGMHPRRPGLRGCVAAAGSFRRRYFCTRTNDDDGGSVAVVRPHPDAHAGPGNLFTTPDGSLSFTYPQTWKVTAVAGQSGSYAVTDSAGATRATLRDKLKSLPNVSVPTGLDSGFRGPFPASPARAAGTLNLWCTGSSARPPAARAPCTRSAASTTPNRSGALPWK